MHYHPVPCTPQGVIAIFMNCVQVDELLQDMAMPGPAFHEAPCPARGLQHAYKGYSVSCTAFGCQGRHSIWLPACGPVYICTSCHASLGAAKHVVWADAAQAVRYSP